MSDASSTGSSGQKRSSQESMEVDESAKAREDAPSSAKKSKAVKQSLKEEEIEEKTSEISLEAQHSAKNKIKKEDDESIVKSPSVSAVRNNDKKVKKEVKDEFVSEDDDDILVVEVEKKKARKGPSKRQLKAAEDCRNITKMWEDEEPYVNVERPFPSKADGVNFCWYDLSEQWSADSMPQPVPVDDVHRHFKYNNKAFVQLPFAQNQNTLSQGRSRRPRGELIFENLRSFSCGIRCLDHLEAGIRSYWRNFSAKTLRKMFEGQSKEVCDEYLRLLTNIARIARRAESIVTKPLPTLVYEGGVKSVSMSQEQAASLLAHAFFCMILPRSKEDFNHFSFHKFHLTASPIYMEKMKFILYYFKTVSEEMPGGTLTYSRQAYDFRKDEKWEQPLSQCVVTAEGLIEEMAGCLQVDFANEYIGGGVMSTGAVQEEIMFLCCPEMMVSMLLCDLMEPDEAILIQGAQQYSTYEGYSSSLTHVPMALDRNVPRDRFGRARSYLVAIDAVQYKHKSDQYEKKFITREIKKAYAGFMRVTGDSPARPIATGNWGCGVFNGDRDLKSMIQLIAASKAGRPMIYVTFNNETFADELESMVQLLHEYKVTNGILFEMLADYAKKRTSDERVFEFIRRKVLY